MLVHAKLLLTAVFWGGTFIAGRVVAGEVKPFSAALSRFAIASLVLLILTWRGEGKFPKTKREHIIPIILLGMTGILGYNVFFFKGLQLITAGRASVIVATNPILIAVSSSILFGERLDPIRVVGIISSVMGAFIAITRGNLFQITNGDLGWGEFYIFGCVLSWVAYSLIGKAIMTDLSPLVAVTYSSVVGSLALLIPAFSEGVVEEFHQLSAMSWMGLLYLALFGTVLGFQWYYEGIKSVGPTQAGVFINFVPISAIVLAFLILREPITVSLLAGAVLVSSGVYLTNSASRRAAG